ncbi:MAG TPA: hypothetical protein VKE69_07045 [Planctomycetota bacterium]|nr:hypothetical protein [Planctomycetota bacterium]
MPASIRSLAALALLASGPCFELRIATEVDVRADGSSLRKVDIETTDPDKAALAALGDPAASGASIVARLEGFEVASKARRAQRTRRIEPGERARDIALQRHGRGPAASNDAIVRVDDYVLFRRVRYRETIRDGTERGGVAAAMEPVTELLSRTLSRAANDLLSAGYELDRLRAYFRGDGRRALQDIAVGVVEASDDEIAAVDTALAVFAREGVTVNGPALRRLLGGESTDVKEDLEAVETSLRDGCLAKVASLLRRRGTTPDAPGPAVAPAELQFLLAEDLVASTIERALVAETGSDEGLKRLWSDRESDLFGCFGGAAFDPSLGADTVRWRTLVRMPGQPLRTNGAPLSDGTILWLQRSGDLAHRTTLLEAESLVLDDGAIAALGGNSSGLTAEDLLELLSDLGMGRDRVPKPKRVAELRAAASGDRAARERISSEGGEYDVVCRILRIPKTQKGR